MIAFISRKNQFVLWNVGNYQYEITSSDGFKQSFKISFEEALIKLEQISELSL